MRTIIKDKEEVNLIVVMANKVEEKNSCSQYHKFRKKVVLILEKGRDHVKVHCT